ncbi:winged helix-turn-helix domain-containing protein [Actinokineospora sp. G85]|uniref:winged helix-turn-helix domain-containing protein n=1 Tax=Actinokineospora sp. G85 TaxID=3406626 RepID=UPI003C716D49
MADHLQLDGTALRTLAHPLRSRLLSELRTHGAATATDLARRLDTNTGATSYHLRKLAEVDLVVETGEGTGKQRYWAAAQTSHGWHDSDFTDDPDSAAAAGWLRQHYWGMFNEKMAHWEQERPRWPAEWGDAAHFSDLLVTMDVGQLNDLMGELEEVVARHRQRAIDSPAPGARQVIVLLNAMPTDPGLRP